MRATPLGPLATRRRLIGAGAGLLAIAVLRPAHGTPEEMMAAVREFVGEAPIQPGRVTLDIPPLVENGNAVPVTVTVDSPMTATEHVRSIALFNEKNPQPHVGVFHLGRTGRPRPGGDPDAARELADASPPWRCSSDGSYWSDTAKVIVTLAACVES